MGKISVKYYLNKKVKPQKIRDLRLGEFVEGYPLYYYITIRRKTIHKPSRLNIFLSEEMFEGGVSRVEFGDELLEAAINYEINLIKGICSIYEQDYERGEVKTAYRALGDRGFASKDEYTNDLNAYIEFYATSIRRLAKAQTKEAIRVLFNDETWLELEEKLGKFSGVVEVKPTTELGDRVLNYYSKAFGDSAIIDLYAYYVIKLFEINTTSQAINRIGLTVYEWEYGDAKEWVWDNIIRSRTEGQKMRRKTTNKFLLSISRAEYDKKIIPIIDDICSAEHRIEAKYEEMKRGL